MISQQLDEYVTQLKGYNEHTNIYSASAYDKLQFHIEDSLNILNLIPKTTRRILDIGSGSGLPSIPMAIARTDINVTAVESKSRKTRFLAEVKTAIGLHNLTVVTANIAEYIHKEKPTPDVITAKAFAPIDRLLPLLKTLAYTRSTAIIPVSQAQATELNHHPFPGFILKHGIETDGTHTYLILELKKLN
jgi:16S rRNA (guanine527-N7)-methyltransferase